MNYTINQSDYRGEPVEPVRLSQILAAAFKYIAWALLVATLLWLAVYGGGVAHYVLEAM